MYSVKSLKTWQGREGLGIQCWLYRDGIKVAQFTNDGNGGMGRFHWIDTYGTEEARLEEYIKGMTWECNGRMVPKDADMYVSELCDAFDTIRLMKRKLKKVTYYRVKNQTYAPDSWSVIKQPFDARVKLLMEIRFGDNLGEILNERPEYCS